MSTTRLVRIAATLVFTAIVQTPLAGREWHGHVEWHHVQPTAPCCPDRPRPHALRNISYAAFPDSRW